MHLLKLKLGVKRMFIVSTYEINMHHQSYIWLGIRKFRSTTGY